MDSGNEINDVALGDFMDASGTPAGIYLPAQHPRHFACRAVLRDMLRDKRLQQIIHSILNHLSASLSFFSGWVSALHLGGKYLLGCELRLMKGNAPIWPDRIFPQPSTCGPIQDDKHLAAFRRDLRAEAGKTNVPVNQVDV